MANAELYDHAAWDESIVHDVLSTPALKSFFATFKEWSVTLLETGRDRDPNVTATIDATIRDAVSHVKSEREGGVA